jgi:peptidyl-prolyl cis-trans isomerase B (cyclophilin B)
MCRKNGQLYAKATTYERYNLHFYLNVLIMIILKTNIGDIHIEVDEKKAPITAKNFINYVKNGFYDSTIFHRVIKNFMIQGGGFTEDMSEKSTKKEIENEAKNGLKNAKYTIAMARTTMPHSASSQFFINTTNNSFLDYPAQDGWGYCVFGEVVEGHAVVDKINLVNTGHHGMHADVPNDADIIEKATVKAVTITDFFLAGFLVAVFLGAVFLGAVFLVAVFLVATFLTGAFLATAFLVAVFLAAT